MRKILYIAFSLLIALPLAAAQNYTVVLDAGHGGKDPGAVGKFSYEKDLNLALVLKMGELLKYYPEWAAELHEKDRVHTYGSFYIADLLI